jgi:hypothetical protein
MSATSSATASCAGARRRSTTSASCPRHRHLSPGEPGIPGPDRLDRRSRRRSRLSRHRRRHRQPHHHGQRPVGPGLGRGRHRGRGRDAGPADPDADPRSHRLQADRRHAGRRDRHRPGADRHPDAAQEGRGRQVRRILRRRPGQPDPGRPGDHRQHGPGIRRHLRLLPDQRGDRRLSEGHRPRRRPRRPGRSLRQGAGPVVGARRRRADLHRHPGAGPVVGAAVAGRPQASAGPRAADRVRRQVRRVPGR